MKEKDGNTLTGGSVQTNANGDACVSGLTVSSLAGVGTYSVTETVPTGYHNVDAAGTTRSGISVTESTCASGAHEETFHNMPLSDITVSVNSQVDGGTQSTIDCDPATPGVDRTTTLNGHNAGSGDGSYTKQNLEPGTYTCTIVVDP